jgi:hypothetical protein
MTAAAPVAIAAGSDVDNQRLQMMLLMLLFIVIIHMMIKMGTVDRLAIVNRIVSLTNTNILPGRGVGAIYIYRRSTRG